MLKIKKLAAVLVIAAVVMLAFASCAQDEATTQNNTTAPVDDGYETSGDDVAAARILPNLPDTDWEGHVFRVQTYDWEDGGDWGDWLPRDIAVEELMGNPLNDSVYHRNRILEERYNFTIEQVQQDGGAFTRRAVQAGDRSFDAVSVTMNATIDLAQGGLLVDLNEVHYIDLEKPWWDQGANYGMSIGGRLFLTSGDFVLVNRDACPGILFNKQLLQNLQLECPYTMVHEGRWTLQNFYEMIRQGGADLGGHGGTLNWETDRFGLVAQRDSVVAFLHGAGERFTTKDAEDIPIWIFGNTDRTFVAMERIFDVMLNADALNLHRLPEPIYPKSEAIFQEDRGLFMWVRLRIVENLRGMETDFGILPMPWLDENQGAFHHTVNRFTGHAMAIPNFHDDESLARTGFILEAISAESRYTVIPAYYDVQLTTQIARDEESTDMLDIIFSTTVWDTGEIYNWGDLSWQLLTMIDNENRDIASRLERLSTPIERSMERTIDRFLELD